MSKNPADIMGIKKGRFQAGYDADFVLVDPDKKAVIRASDMISRGKNTPLDGRELFGEVVMTIRKGVTVYEKQ
jgi:dihydroorotase